MICTNCHTENREDAKFCNECGQLLSKTADDELSAGEDDAIDDLNHTIKDDSNLSPAELIELAALELKTLREQEEADASVLTSDTAPNDSAESTTEKPTQSKADSTCASHTPFAHETDKTAPLDPTPPAAFTPTQPAQFSSSNDLSGLDECLVDSNYVPPQNSWRGSTMEMNTIKDEDTGKPREFKEHRTQTKPTRQPLQKKSRYALIIVGGLVVAILLFVYSTYALELWGGKIIPDVTGKTQVDAEYLLEDKGFTVETNEVHSDETQGIVLYVTPQVGDRADSNSSVVINVSIPRIIPDVSNSYYTDIVDALHEQGISNITTKEELSSEEAGLILNITPQPGSIVKASDEVVLTVATPYAVPNVLGLTYEEAQQALREAGYDATIVYDSRESDRNNIVLFTDPAPDSLLEPGSTVTLTISQSRGATLIEETNKFLQDLQKKHNALIATNGNAYLIKTIDSVKFVGNETTSFVATVTTTLDTQTEIQIKGTIVWDSLNYIVSIDVDS